MAVSTAHSSCSPAYTVPTLLSEPSQANGFMFSKLPQKIPFNLLGDEAKLAFRSQAGGITKLATTRVSEALVRSSDGVVKKYTVEHPRTRLVLEPSE